MNILPKLGSPSFGIFLYKFVSVNLEILYVFAIESERFLVE
ncbi:hypothetical protein HNR78_001518 [Parageobacillus toebii NBRC 107807]|uniref:Uncharacterized protein n=1 Tax=Parageobacillus toebii NBRC 107807 TaxID=1223503 RepID=A0AA89ST15_9BACL|nr:hypothetical protein [Parageobacillus toebii NBRC 107807]